jgi:hypothetical protein
MWDIASAELTAELFMKHIIYENGICIEIVLDRDSKFTSKMWQDFHAALGITLSVSSSRHQSTDGQTERAIAHVEKLMRMNINYKQSNWVSLLSTAVAEHHKDYCNLVFFSSMNLILS